MMDRAQIEALKVSVPISSVAGQYTPLRRAGREFCGRCPLHADSTPSFYVDDEKGAFICFGCGASGDVVKLVMLLEHVGFNEAIERLDSGSQFPKRCLSEVPKVTASPSNYRPAALKIWNSAGSLHGTIAESYLRKRGIGIDRLADLRSLRFARLPYQGSVETYPVLVAAAHDWRGDFVGIQRTYLSADGCKLAVDMPKMTLGSFNGGAIQLGHNTEDIIVCEGLEDGLSLFLEVPGVAVWVAAGANRMKSLELPPSCRRVTIAADNDAAGTRAAQEAAEAFDREGRMARVMRPAAAFKDFNSELMSEISQ
jgi:DNA primase